MHILLVIIIIILLLGLIGGLTYLFARLAVGPSSYHTYVPPPEKQKAPTVYFPPPPLKPTPTSSTITKYSKYNPIDDGAYIKIPQYDSPGNDIGQARAPENYNMDITKCKERCNKTPGCVAFGWDASQKNYCTNKNKLVTNFTKWNGELYIKK